MENNTFEMEQLKEQIAILNKKLDHETIVNENLLRNAMSSKMRNANNYAWIDLAMGVVTDTDSEQKSVSVQANSMQEVLSDLKVLLLININLSEAVI